MKRFEPKRILAPVDFSHFSIEALKAALDISEIRGATITALHVAEEPSFPDTYGQESVVHANWQALRNKAFQESEKELEALVAESGADQQVERKTIMGDPSNEIVRIAKDGGYDLIVMSTHGRTGLSRLLMGSVAERVIRHAPCPVFVIRGDSKS